MTETLAKKNEYEAQCGRRPYPTEGELWRHFKGGLYSIIATVQHTENGRWYIVYRAEKTFGKAVKGEVYLRPAPMFMSKTDKRKYPEAEQEFRFEKVEMMKNKYADFVVEKLDERTILEQLAEEAAELSQAALKLIRARRLNNNTTPLGESDALDGLYEEIQDVLMVLHLFDPEALEGFVENAEEYWKYERWARRLDWKEGENDEK